jgi:hypothetical protein
LGLDFSKIKISPGRYRSGERRGSVGLALGVRGRLGGGRGGPQGGRAARNSPPKSLEAAAPDIEYRNGRFAIGGTDRSIGLAELAAGSRRS